MWANSVHTCIVTWPGEVAGIRRGCRERWSYVGGGDEEGVEGCHGARRAEPRLRGAGGRGLERRKERGGQPDKQNPCCFISARLARHRPFIRARFRPMLAATPVRCVMDPYHSFVDVPRRTGLSTQYFSSLLINDTAESKNTS